MGGRTIRGILLDTHVWIWLYEKSPELKPNIVNQINQWGKKGGVYISAISVWELSVLVAKERIVLKKPIRDWVTAAFNQPGVKLAPLTADIAIEKYDLKRKAHE